MRRQALHPDVGAIPPGRDRQPGPHPFGAEGDLCEVRVVVPSSSRSAVRLASPPRSGPCVAAPASRTKVAAMIGRSRRGKTQSGIPLASRRTSGFGARNAAAGADCGGFERSSGLPIAAAVALLRPMTVSSTPGLSWRYVRAAAWTASGVTEA